MILFPSDTCLEGRLLDHMVVLIYWGICILFSIMALPIYILIKKCSKVLFPVSSSTTVISCVFVNNHLNRCEVISYYHFGLHFSDNYWREHLFIYLLAICMSVDRCPFFFLLLSCMCSLYILDINPLSQIQFANIFSHS